MTTLAGHTIPPIFTGSDSASGGGGGIINLGNHTFEFERIGVATSRELQLSMLGANVGYLSWRCRPLSSVGVVQEIMRMDGVDIFDVTYNGLTPYPLTILGGPPDTSLVSNNNVDGVRVGYENEWIRDNLGLGGANSVPENDYEWRFSFVSGEPPQSTTASAVDGVWHSIINADDGRWEWNLASLNNFTTVMTIDVRESLSGTIVATGTITIISIRTN